MTKRKFISVNRWRMQLGYNTIGILGIGLVVAKTMQEILINIEVQISIIYLFVFGVVTLWGVGYLWDRLGFYSDEVDYVSERNPYFEQHIRGKKK